MKIGNNDITGAYHGDAEVTKIYRGATEVWSGEQGLFDEFSMTNAGIWDLTKRHTAYAGPAVRVGLAADSGATTLDIGFNADGTFDMAAYSAFGTGSEKVTIWYDQSGNGWDLARTWHATNCPIIRTSSYNSKPCVYFTQGSLGNAGFTNWNGKADAHIVIAGRSQVGTNSYMLAGGSSNRIIYYEGGGPDRKLYWATQGIHSIDSHYTQTARLQGFNFRFQFDGGGATNALKARLFQNGAEETRDTGNGSHPATLSNETGLYLNGEASAANGSNMEYFAFYYFGNDLTAGEISSIDDALKTDYFTHNASQLFCVGDSHTVNSANGGPLDPQAYPNVLKAALEAETGTTWNLLDLNITAEPGAETERVLQLMQAGADTLDLIDVNYDHSIVCAWAGTNDFGNATPDSVNDVKTGSLNIATPAFNLGADVYYGNMLPRTDLDAAFGAGANTAYETARGTYNSQIGATLSGVATLVDLAGRAELDDSTDLTYFQADLVHLTDAGYAAVADAFFDAIELNL